MSAPTVTIGKQTIWRGDCIDVMNTFPEGSVDVVVTSPPYKLGVQYRTHRDDRDRQDYLCWMGRVFQAIRRVLKEDGSLFINLGGSPTDPWVSLDVAQVARRSFTLQNRLAWVKSVAIGDQPCIGHVKPVNSRRFLNQAWEEVFHFTKTGAVPLDRLAVGVPFADKSNLTRGGRGSNGDKRCRGNVWYIPYEMIQCRGAKGEHPATFPVALAERCIKLHGVRAGTVVLDPFAGTGSTLIAAHRLGVIGHGIDVDDMYCDFAARRLRGEG